MIDFQRGCQLQIAIINYGCGNLTSVAGAVRAIGFEPNVTSDPKVVAKSDRIILPGVGAFGDCMRQLQAAGMIDVLEEMRGRRPILGICVGAQLMCRESEEFGRHGGLGWINADVKLLRPKDPMLRVPHVGWNDLDQAGRSVLFDGVPEDALFYYVHSYAFHCDSDEVVIGKCDYGGPFTAAFAAGGVFGVQFHPEKSQQWGLTVLRNFIEKTT
jgi:glutamine amidotransferase